MVILLARAGQDVEARNKRGQTPYMLAATAGRSSTVRALLELGADPLARCHEDGTVLHSAAFSDNTRLMSYLFATKVPIDAKDSKGRTALAIAVIRAREPAGLEEVKTIGASFVGDRREPQRRH
jgi:ankyrin repeat protein